MADLSSDDLCDVFGDAELLLRRGGYDVDDVPSAARLVSAILGAPPAFAPIRLEACMAHVGGQRRVFIRRGTTPIRARWLALHELAEAHYDEVGYRGADVEARCNAMASALAAPRGAVRRAVRDHGHAIHTLADALKTPQGATVLRLAEVIGRPCALLRDAGPIVRGGWFDWPPDVEGFRHLLKGRRADVHPLRIVDGGSAMWALMARAA